MSTKAQAPKRFTFVDSLRGLAVVFMVPLHTSHGWVRPDARTGDLWSASQFFGGLAAPLFVALAGVSLGLQWANAQALGRRPDFAKDARRGLQLIVLGYLLRLQMWILDAGGYKRPSLYLPQLLLLLGYGLLYYAIAIWPKARARAQKLGATAIAALTLGFTLVALYAPTRWRGLLRVDVLQCIGASLALLASVAATRGNRFAQTSIYLALALGIGLLTPWLRAITPGLLPQPIAAYLAQWNPDGGKQIIALFPLFPWAAYACVGAALGLAWARAGSKPELELQLVGLTALGGFVALCTSETWTPVYALMHSEPWLTQPIRLAYRIGLVFVLVGAAYALRRRNLQASLSPLEVLGRASLLVYWVHLEFAFGAASSLLARRLDLRAWALGSAVLLAAMWLLAYLRVVGPPARLRLRTAAPSQG